MTGASEALRYPQDEPLHQASRATGSAPQFSKVPEVALGFWIIKVLATTLGETGGDAVTMSMKSRLRGRNADLSGDLSCSGHGPNSLQELQRLSVLADHRRDDDRGHDNRRLRRPFAGNRISRRLGAAARVPDGLACGLAMVGRHGLGQHDHHAEGRNVLLGHDSVFSDARHGAWRLGRRYEQSRLWRRRNPVRWGARRHSRALCLHTDVACDAVLGCLHSHAAARSDARRSARQAPRQRRLCNQPLSCLRDPRRAYRCTDCGVAETGRRPSGQEA